MDLDWLGHAAAQGVLSLSADHRPAWLWAADGETLLWSNGAARLMGARLQDGALVLPPPAKPIHGQVSRILRMGLVGRSTRSRVQFLAGRQPLAAPCLCTPLTFGEGERAVLIVGLEPIPAEIIAHPESGIPTDVPETAPAVENEPVAAEGPISADIVAEIAETGAPEPVPDAAAEADGFQPPGEDVAAPVEPDVPAVADVGTEATEPLPYEPDGLASLFDRLAQHDDLYAPLGEADDLYDPELVHDHALNPPPVPEPLQPSASDWDEQAGAEDAPAAYDDLPESQPILAQDEPDDSAELVEVEPIAPQPQLWMITGRGFVPDAEAEPEPEPAAEAEDEMPNAPLAPEAVERVSRYNFEELSRILTDRVGREPEPQEPSEGPPPRSAPVVALSEESLVLNRLPVGILLFREQDILFVNRALVDLTGHESATALRAMGLAAIIPSVEGQAPAGPVTQLLRRDGTRVVVSARLQSVSWQGRPAFMLSARVPESRPQDEHAIKTFSSVLATHLGADMVAADRTGLISTYLSHGVVGDAPQPGDPLTRLVALDERGALKAFLESPAQRAEFERPSIRLRGPDDTALLLFVEGRAGPAAGFFGFVLPPAPVAADHAAGSGLPGAALERISRDLRRPLNTILGFAELMTSEAFGPLAPRYLEYARDIETAGKEIGDLADELDEFVKLAAAAITDDPADATDLAALLARCLSKVRTEAIGARVLLRSSISERLPVVRVDAPSLSQAVLNLLASAIRHSEQGGRVVLSAQQDADGGVSIHVRDTAPGGGDIADRFVIFREGRERDGSLRQPAASSIGLTLTRSLIAVNALSLSIDPANEQGTLMTLTIPPDRVVAEASPAAPPAPEA